MRRFILPVLIAILSVSMLVLSLSVVQAQEPLADASLAPQGGTCLSGGFTLHSPFCEEYNARDLGSVPGLPTNYGGLTFLSGTTDTLLIGGAANNASGDIYSIQVVRDAEQHITGFSGTATFFAEGPYNDGGLAYGPGGVLFYARYNINEVGQITPGSTIVGIVTPLTPLGVASSVGGLNFVPPGYPGEGQLKLVSYNASRWYSADTIPDGTGTYSITNVVEVTVTQGGPEGFAYVPPASPEFTDFGNMLVSEYNSGAITVFDIDAQGNPIASSRRLFLTGLTGAEGAVIDPVSGDFLFSTFGGTNRVVAVGGFAPAAVQLAGFSAQAETSHIRLTWETTAELNNAGFNLYRGDTSDAPDEQLNDALIPSEASGSEGAAYEWIDADVEAGTTYYYWLDSIDRNGTTQRYGPVSATIQVPTAVTLRTLTTSMDNLTTERGYLVALALGLLATLPISTRLRRWRKGTR
jgi:hypothetical protein